MIAENGRQIDIVTECGPMGYRQKLHRSNVADARCPDPAQEDGLCYERILVAADEARLNAVDFRMHRFAVRLADQGSGKFLEPIRHGLADVRLLAEKIEISGPPVA